MHARHVPIATIAAWLGHASAAFTMAVYALSQDDGFTSCHNSSETRRGGLQVTPRRARRVDTKHENRLTQTFYRGAGGARTRDQRIMSPRL